MTGTTNICTGQITQNGVHNPTLTITSNDTGVTFSTERTEKGFYTITGDGDFMVNDNLVMIYDNITQFKNKEYFDVRHVDNNTIGIMAYGNKNKPRDNFSFGFTLELMTTLPDNWIKTTSEMMISNI